MGNTFGYCRISTLKQNIERQKRNINSAYGKDIIKIYEEAYTGKKADRPEWSKLLNRVKEGDTIVFDSVSRMSRNAEDGFTQYRELYEKGVNLVFLKEPYVNTDVYRNAMDSNIQMTGEAVDIILEAINKYLMTLAQNQIRLAFDQAEKEVTDLSQRTKEGLITARQNGKQIGQRKGAKLHVKKADEAKKYIRDHCKDFGANNTDSDEEIYTRCNISRNTYYKYKREIREELEQGK